MMSEGTKYIVTAMKAHGIRKVVACLSGELWAARG